MLLPWPSRFQAWNIATPWKEWLTDRRGNVAILFALCLIPAIGLVGLGIDFFRGLSYKSRLDAAADSAALVAITTAQAYIGANSQTEADPLPTPLRPA